MNELLKLLEVARKNIFKVHAELEKLKAENEKLRKALEEFDNDDNWVFVNKYIDREIKTRNVDACFIGKYDPRVFATMALKGTPLDNTQEGEQVSISELYKDWICGRLARQTLKELEGEK